MDKKAKSQAKIQKMYFFSLTAVVAGQPKAGYFSGPVCYNNSRLNYARMNRGTNLYGQERNYMKGHRYV